MKLTDEQKSQMHAAYFRFPGDNKESMQGVADAYLAMLQASKTHRVVEAPEGYEFDGPAITIATAFFAVERIAVNVKPIPKPCPPPVLDPVTVTVEECYGVMPTIPDGYEAKFGRVDVLAPQGFGAAIKFDFKSTIADINLFPRNQHVIGLRKWESA